MAFTSTNLTLYATMEWHNTGISISSGQQLIVSATGFVKPWSGWSDPGIGPDGDPDWPTGGTPPVYIPGAPFCMLIGRINSGVPFPIGAYCNLSNLGATGISGTLYLAINDVIGGFGDNLGSFDVTIQTGVLDPTDHENLSNKDACYGISSDGLESSTPISLFNAEKREEVTDLSVMTPAGILAFTRTYRQSKLGNADYQLMGLGWTHNHFGKLTLSGTSPNRTADVLIPGGGFLKLTEDSDSAGHFDATAGSTSTLDYVSGPDEYILTAQDKSQLAFDGTSFQLIRRDWPSGESWTYTYNSGKLTEVADTAYDINSGQPTVYRRLQFSYISNPNEFDDGQLWRVGDHTASDLDTGSPSGRYVEFGYVPERDDGDLVGSPKALLASVEDVRSNVSTYDWYGQDSGEDDDDLLNFLVAVNAPGGIFQQKELSYELSGSDITAITQKLGIEDVNPALLEIRYEFESNVTNEITAGQETQYHFLGGAYTGMSDPAGNRRSEWPGLHYRPDSQVDANQNETTLLWNTDGKYLQQVTDALGHPTGFEYNTSGPSADTLDYSLDADGRKTEYTYGDGNNPRRPTRIKVMDSDEVTVLHWQEFVYDGNGRTLQEKVLDPSDGTTVLQQTTRTYYTSGNGNGLLETVTQEDIGGTNDVTTTYHYDSVGRVVQTNRSSNFGSCEISYTVYDAAGNVVATICNYDPGQSADPTTAAEAAALYDPQYPDKNHVTTHVYDEMGRRVATTTNAGSDFAQTSRTFYDALNRVWRTIANYQVQGGSAPGDWVWDSTENRWEDGVGNAISHGTENNQNIIADTAYNERGMVRLQRDVLGHVTLYGYDDAGRSVKTVQNASDDDYNNDYSGAGSNPDLGLYSESTNPDEDIITEQVYDAAGNLVETIDPLGKVSFTVYDALNRPVKTVRNAKDDATLALNPGDQGYDETNDPRSDDYEISTDPDHDQIDITEYDALGRVIRTRRLLENRGSSAVWDVTLYGYDALGRQVKTIRSASDPEYAISADPDLSLYDESTNADEDIIAETIYDEQGRVQYTIDVNETETWQVYDGLGRQVLTIANFVDDSYESPDNWVWEGGVWKDEPGGTTISHGAANDQNIISQTVYDDDGRVLYTRNVEGKRAYHVYDGLGRQVLVITNYVEQSASDPADWEWDANDTRWEDGAGNPISFGTNNDENVLSETIYDDQGRVQQTRDVQGRVTRFVYDSGGRRVRTIGNYSAQGASDPADWEWDANDTRWEDGAGNPISFGADNGQNRIGDTIYDVAGRVVSTRDTAGRVSRSVYDALGRRVRAIGNFVDNGEDPSLWVWDDTDQRYEESDGTPIDHGANFDQNLIAETTYNKAGQVVTTRDTRGTQTGFTYDTAGRRLSVTQDAGGNLETVFYTCYDKAGRVLRTIQNWVGDDTSPDDVDEGEWVFIPEHNGHFNDANRITEFLYDNAGRRIKVIDPVGNETETVYYKDGQVESVIDAEEGMTQYRYDDLRRRNLVVQNYDEDTDPSTWSWSGSQWEEN